MKHTVDFEKLKAALKEIPLDKRGIYITQSVASILAGTTDQQWIVKKNQPKLLSKNYTEEFDKFWNAYPARNGSKQGKMPAYIAWQKAGVEPSELLKLTLASLSIQCRLEDWKKDNGTFIPMASSYLNQRRWEDELPKLDDKKVIKDEFGRDTEV